MSLVKLEFDGPLAILTFSNPPINAFSTKLGEDMLPLLEEIRNSDARAMLTLTDAPNFCAGADVNMFVGCSAEQGAELVGEVMDFIQTLETISIPTVVAVNGMCLAAGMEVMMAHDIVIAADNAQIGQVEAQIGTTPLAGGSSRLAARVGVARAKQMVFEGRFYDAKTLDSWNVVNKVVPKAELHEKARKYAMRLANGPTVAHKVSKAVINATGANGVAAGDQVIREQAGHVFATQDKQNALQTFLKKGPPALMSGEIKFSGK